MNYDTAIQKFQHGERGNPHPQYQKYKTFTTPLLSTKGQLVKLVDTKVQARTDVIPDEINRTLTMISFIVAVSDVAVVSGGGMSKSLLSFDLKFGYDNLPRMQVDSIALNSDNRKTLPIIAYLTKTSETTKNEYQLVIYVKTTDTYSQLRVTLLDFYTSNYPIFSDNRYNISGNPNNSVHMRENFFFSPIPKPQTWTAPTNFSYMVSTIADDKKGVVEATGDYSVTVTNSTNIVRLLPTSTNPADRNLRWIVVDDKDSIVNGKQLVLIFKSDNLSVTSQENYEGGILLKNNTTVVPPLNATITLSYFRGAWYEISRSF